MSIPAASKARLIARITLPRVVTTSRRREPDHQRTRILMVEASSAHGRASGAGSASTPSTSAKVRRMIAQAVCRSSP